MMFRNAVVTGLAATIVAATGLSGAVHAQDRSTWDRGQQAVTPDAPKRRARVDDAYRPPEGSQGSLGTLVEPGQRTYEPSGVSPSASGGWSPPVPPGQMDAGSSQNALPSGSYANNDAYRPPGRTEGYPRSGDYGSAGSGAGSSYGATPPGVYGEPYAPPREYSDQDRRAGGPYDRRYEDERESRDGTYSRNEMIQTGHRFFGSVSQGLASAVEYVFQRAGRPNGYILGEDAGGAFVAGLRYGEGMLYTKDAGNHKVYWQGPSLGYDFGGEGSKTMVLVYNLRDPGEIYERFAGVQGSAYLVGGVSVQFQKYGDIMLAPIRSGIGLRLGANVGYLKYTRTPTWNPF